MWKNLVLPSPSYSFPSTVVPLIEYSQMAFARLFSNEPLTERTMEETSFLRPLAMMMNE
ncbi:hypothetical protein SDC9_159626 [bioreactor metagenome]|uniref:Uncharacterized protein n=1 Tax=bioreactor metagenome TaxID=1076179 RepID=A0A645FEB0_9ZZZZ